MSSIWCTGWRPGSPRGTPGTQGSPPHPALLGIPPDSTEPVCSEAMDILPTHSPAGEPRPTRASPYCHPYALSLVGQMGWQEAGCPRGRPPLLPSLATCGSEAPPRNLLICFFGIRHQLFLWAPRPHVSFCRVLQTDTHTLPAPRQPQVPGPGIPFQQVPARSPSPAVAGSQPLALCLTSFCQDPEGSASPNQEQHRHLPHLHW